MITDPGLLEERAHRLGLPFTAIEAGNHTEAPGSLPVLPVPLPARVTPGQPDPANAAHVLETLTTAVDGCRNGDFDAMVTGPVHKATINRGGFTFSGHTEFIAARCGVAGPVMMLMNDRLRVALVTTHVPLSRVSGMVTGERLRRTLTVVHSDLRRKFGIDRPRLLVCGLNPHAGEEGYLGREEIEIMIPALDALREQGLELIGPAPADSAFTPDSLQGIDCVIAMYHDQGLPPLKALGFGETVNITLGLPILRTSVDHGTAFQLAGTGKADCGSLRAALDCARQLGGVGAEP